MNWMSMPVSSRKLTPRQDIIALLGAFCLFLSTLEYLIPKPLPFFRLGLANLPLLLGIRFLSPKDLIILLGLKVLGQGLINGTLASHVFLFSLTGSAVSLCTMWLVSRLGADKVSLVGISLTGAMFSSMVQLLLSVFFVFGQTALVIAPLALGSGLITGVLTGIFAMKFSQTSTWLVKLEKRYRESV